MKKVLIFGLGSYKEGSGIAAARFFLQQGARVRVTDKKTERELVHQVCALKKFAKPGRLRFVLGRHRTSDIRWSELIVQNPGTPDDSPYLQLARQLKKNITNDAAIFLELTKSPVLGVTGTRGKSTTTALLFEMVKRKFHGVKLGGNIGVSPLTFLDELKAKDPAVLELSSWLLHHVKQGPEIAVVTNILEDHLNRYRSVDDYAADKANILLGPGVAVLNYDNKGTRKLGFTFYVSRFRKIAWFSTKSCPPGESTYVKRGEILARSYTPGYGWEEKKICKISEIRLLGGHNVANVLAAAAAAWVFGVPLEKIRAVIKSFKSLPNRLELVKTSGGIKWYNDTTATSPDAVVAALAALDHKKRIVLIAGGTDKQLDFHEMARAIKCDAKTSILFTGTATQKLVSLLLEQDYHLVSSMKEAISLAQKLAKRGEIVLLSPGAASFGIFKNEFDRGEQFVHEVNKVSK